MVQGLVVRNDNNTRLHGANHLGAPVRHGETHGAHTACGPLLAAPLSVTIAAAAAVAVPVPSSALPGVVVVPRLRGEVHQNGLAHAGDVIEAVAREPPHSVVQSAGKSRAQGLGCKVSDLSFRVSDIG